MAKQKSALQALKALEKSYEEQRKALLRKAEEEMSVTVHKIVGNLARIAKDFPKVVSNAVSSLLLASSTQPVSNATPEVAATKPVTAGAQGQEAGRFRAMGVKAHRAKLGLSADYYGRLVGVSGLTIYSWESGKSKPREAQKLKWLAIRSLGKEEALRQLGTAAPKAAPATAAVKPVVAKPAAAKPKKRGTFKQTAEELILSLLKGKKALTSELAAAWKKSGRGGKVDQPLSRMVAAKKLKRKPLGGKRGSEYSVA